MALALQHDPELVDHVKAVVVMGDAFGENGHRGNVSPVAQATVFVSHDASAVACALDATPFRLRRGPMRVVTEGIAAGQAIQMREGESFPSTAWAEAPAQSVCVDVDAPRLRAEFRSCFVR